MVTIAEAQAKDAQAIALLLEEMDRFYGGTPNEPIELQLEQIGSALFAAIPPANAVLAWEDDALIGIASYSFLWPAAGLTQSLYLKELYVAEAKRQQGVGKLLMEALFAVAKELGCSRVEWTTDSGNTAAQHFYEQLGVSPHVSKIFYRAELD